MSEEQVAIKLYREVPAEADKSGLMLCLGHTSKQTTSLSLIFPVGLLTKEYVHWLLSPTWISTEGTLEFTLCMSISVAGKEVLAVDIPNVAV